MQGIYTYIPQTNYVCREYSVGNYSVVTIHSACIISFSVELIVLLHKYFPKYRGPGSSVSIATDYGLDGPESNPGGDEIFRPSTPALGSTQPPVKWVPGLSRG